MEFLIESEQRKRRLRTKSDAIFPFQYGSNNERPSKVGNTIIILHVHTYQENNVFCQAVRLFKFEFPGRVQESRIPHRRSLLAKRVSNQGPV